VRELTAAQQRGVRKLGEPSATTHDAAPEDAKRAEQTGKAAKANILTDRSPMPAVKGAPALAQTAPPRGGGRSRGARESKGRNSGAAARSAMSLASPRRRTAGRPLATTSYNFANPPTFRARPVSALHP